jgi:hypothetical protein
LLYQGSVTQLQHHLATLNSALPQNRVVLLYISADSATDDVAAAPPAAGLLATQLAQQQ